MKKFQWIVWPGILAAVIAFAIYSSRETPVWDSFKNSKTVELLKNFTAVKEAQAKAAPKGMAPEIEDFFKAARQGKWLTLSNAFWKLGERNGNFSSGFSRGPVPARNKIWGEVENFISGLRDKIRSKKTDDVDRLRGIQWEAAKETWGAFDNFVLSREKYAGAFGRDIINSISAGSIYFGGTDPGRFLVTAMCNSQPTGDPFFTLTQNALADGSYLDYLRSMYGSKIYIPTETDSRTCYENYAADVQRRSAANNLKPGEDVSVTGGRIQITGQTAVMEINGLLVKIIFDKNPSREFYIEESFPLDWMYPHLEPHGLIFKINREPLPVLSEEILRRDHDYWTKYVTPMIGGWLSETTSVSEVAGFVEKVYLRHDLQGFQGDSEFVQNVNVQKIFSKERSAIAGLYSWRHENASDPVEKKRMATEADFAFRQAFVLAPFSPEALYRYVNFLVRENRFSEAILLAETTAKFPETLGSDPTQIHELVNQLKQFQKQNELSADFAKP